MSHPSCINLSSKDESIIAYLCILSQYAVIEFPCSSAETDGCSLKVILGYIKRIILDVKLAVDSELVPHLDQSKGVLLVWAEAAELVLYLHQYDWAVVDGQVGLDDWR